MKKSMSFTVPDALRVVAKLKITDLLKDGPKNINEIADE